MDINDLPRFDEPWPVTPHPHAAATEEHVLQWAEDFRVIPVYSNRERMAAMRSGWAAAYTFPPHTPVEHLNIWADCIAIAEISDDYCSRLTSQGRQADWASLDVRLRTASRTGTCSPEEQDPMVRATADMSARLIAVADPLVQDRWADHYDALWDAWLIEASGHSYTSVDEYVRIRRAAIGTAMVSDILEAVEGIAIPSDAYNAYPFTTLVDAYCDIMAWQNDIASYALEAASGEGNNLVAILIQQNGLTTRQAMIAAVQMLGKRIADYTNAEQSLPEYLEHSNIPASDRPGVLRWAQDNRSTINGVTYWYRETDRYNLSKTTQERLITDTPGV
ncbi:hypothetical protein ACFRMN_05925 [Streptomyces sp. NPDC056835]|uniref:terpene synthase family protein n=1 Tax=Streptomyces sp. NPDC056835 TaxID=3345956 RepID=UPI0036A6853F